MTLLYMLWGPRYLTELNCDNPNGNTAQPQHNLNTVVGLDMKITVQTTPHPPTTHPTTETQM